MFGNSIRVWGLASAAGLVLGLAVAEHHATAAPNNASEGQIVSVDRYGIMLAEPFNGTRRVFAVTQSTKIMRNGNLARLTDLRAGDQARITFRPLGDKLLALTVTAFSP